MEKPPEIFARDREWTTLSDWARDDSTRNKFGIVYGRRRQGKSWLLERLATEHNAWYWEAFLGTARQQLDEFGQSFGRYASLPAAPYFTDWHEALSAVRSSSASMIVLDEFQYLVTASPELPSLLQRSVSRSGGPKTLVCGSAMGAMRDLLASDAPLRGRASLEMIVAPFDYRTSAKYWGLANRLDDAVKLHSLVGGTPAYRDFASRQSPKEFDTFDEWVCNVLLNAAGALFREGRILADEPSLQDRGLYVGILSAISAGATRRGEIASRIGRPENTLAHPLNALVELALVERLEDPLHKRRSHYRLSDPLLRAYRLLIAPNETAIERRGPKHVWPSLTATAESQVYGPHFEWIATQWVASFASSATLGGIPQVVGSSTIADPASKSELEINIVATNGDHVLAIGEAKWNSGPIGLGALEKLTRRRELVGSRAHEAKLLLFSRTGFTPDLTRLARQRPEIELIDLKRLYRGE